MPEVKQPTAKASGPGEKVQKPDIALPQDAITQIQRGGSAPLEHLTKSAKKGKKKGKDSDNKDESSTIGKVRRSGKRAGDTPLGGLRNRRPHDRVDLDSSGDATELGAEAKPPIRPHLGNCLLYTSPSPRDQRGSRMPSSA